MNMQWIEQAIEDEALKNQGINDMNAGNFDEALTKFNQFLERNPRNMTTLQLRGICKCLIIGSKLSEEDLEMLLNAIEDFSSVIRGIYRLGQTAEQLFQRNNP